MTGSVGMPALRTQLAATYLVAGVAVRVRADDPDLLARINDTYGPFLVAGAAVGPRRVEVVLRHEGGSTLVQLADGPVHRFDDDAIALIGMFDAISAGVIRELTRRGRLAIHAGVVAMDQRAVLLAGRSGAGKTTLVLELLRRGAWLMSDELGVIDGDDTTVHPYPRGFHVRPATATLVPELGFLEDLPRHDIGGGSEWSVAPERLAATFGTTVAGSLPLGAIVLLDGAPDPARNAAVHRVPGAIAAVELTASTPAAAHDYAGVLHRLSGITARVPAARLRSGELRASADALIAWLETAA